MNNVCLNKFLTKYFFKLKSLVFVSPLKENYTIIHLDTFEWCLKYNTPSPHCIRSRHYSQNLSIEITNLNWLFQSKFMTHQHKPILCELSLHDSRSQVETTQEKIISLELTTSPSSETAPTDLEEAGISLGEGEPEAEGSLQPDIVQVVNPLLDGGAGRVTAIPVGPAQRLTAYTDQPQ